MRVLLLGLDGFDHGLFEEMARKGDLPRLEALRTQGISAMLESPPPAATIPSWTTILTGVNPGRHGLWDFTYRNGYRVRFSAGDKREAPNVFEMLSTAGNEVVSVGFPGTFPPVEVRGSILAGWDSPAAVHGRRAGCRPEALHDTLVERFGEDYLPFDLLDQFRAGTSAGPQWYREAASRLVETIGRRIELTLFLVDEVADGAPDLVAVHFPEADTAGHHFWHLHDLNSPRRPDWIEDFIDEGTGRVADPLAGIYRSLDSAVGELMDRLHPDCVVIVSDHGMGGNGTRLVSLNRFLAQEGFLNLERDVGVAAGDVLGVVRRIGLEVVPPELRGELLGGFGSTLAGEVASRIRFGSIDWSRTVAFSEDLNYAPSIYVNETGLEPEGIVHRSERTWWLRLLADALEEWKATPAQGEVPPDSRSVVERVHLREDMFRGPFAERMPNLVLELARDQGYTLSLHPGYFRRMRKPVEPLPDELLQGSKGRSMPGSHRPEGLLVLAATDGEKVDTGSFGPVTQESITPLVLELAGYRIPGYFDVEPARVTDGKLEWLDRRSLHDAFQQGRERSRGARPGADSEGEEAVKKRLEDLGYF